MDGDAPNRADGRLTRSVPVGVNLGFRSRRLASLTLLLALTLRAVAAPACDGDCNGNGTVALEELIDGVNIALGNRAARECPAFDPGGDAVVAIDELIAAVSNAVRSCPPPIGVSIGSPSPLALLASSPISVEGTFAGAEAVTCNGVAATVTAATFSAAVPLHAAENVITCLATGPDGRVASASITVILDNVAPFVVIDSPAVGSMTADERVDVTGVVNDVLTVAGAAPPVVRVNGIAADVSNGTFVVPNVPLRPGPNLLTAVATDAVGNSDQTSITLTRQELAGQRLRVVSGRTQMGTVGSELATPLEVQLVDAHGIGVGGRAVTFRVTRGSGLLATATGGAQEITLISGPDGRAAARFILGVNAGRGSHRVTATATGFAGEGVFCASANASAADRIVVISGDQQMGAVGELLPLPLIVGVLDSEGNPVARAPVTFTVVEGDGSLVDGGTSAAMMTGPDGRTAVTWRLGSRPGVNANRVQADVSGLAGLPAVFTATSTAAGRAEDTTLSGVVVDTSNLPVPGITASIVGTSLETSTDDQGRFRLSGVPVGPVRLFLWGLTASRDGVWPDLEFNLVTVAGQDNTLGRPIRLPVLDEESSRIIGGSEDVTLTLPEVPGFSLTVAAGSATFPGGARMDRLTVTQVHFDKVPMPPPNGSQFGFAWTLQPADEVELFTDPGNPDSDGDGLSDGAEVAAGGDPLVRESEAPTVLITNPAEGAVLLQGETISIAATATDNAGVQTVEFLVNDTSFVVDDTEPYELTFTVPIGVSELELSVRATDIAGNVGTAPTVAASVTRDSLTTVQGTIHDPFGNPVVGADVSLELQGLDAEFFDFDVPLNSLPDLTGLVPDVRKRVSAVNFRNPANLFNTDTFGVGLGPDFAARFTGSMRIVTPGVRMFILGADDGARLLINGAVVAEVTGAGAFTEASANVDLAPGNAALEIQYYQRTAAAELQLSHVLPRGERPQVVPPLLLIPNTTLTGVSGAGGTFSFSEVPAALGPIRVTAEAMVDGEAQSGSSSRVAAVPGGATDVGVIVVGENVFPRDDAALATFELNGDVVDSSGNARHAVLLGGEFVPTVWGMGLHVSAVQPTGIDWSAFAALLAHPYTVEFVLTPQVDISSYRKLFSFSDTNDAGWYYLARGIQTYPFDNVGHGLLNLGERHYIAFVSTAPDLVDVYFQGTFVISARAAFTAPGPQAIFFRDDAQTSRREQLDGTVEALRISGVARSAAEIAAVQQRLAERGAALGTATSTSRP